MFKLIKYLKKSALSIVIIVCLLVIQAVCDLSLPEYTSNIVNVGIQQGGVENSVPSVIRESELNKITLFMDKSSKDKVLDNYTLLNKKDYVKYKDKYPGLKDESIYELNTKDKDTIDDLNVIFGKAILIVSGLEGDSKEVKAMKAQLMSKLPPQATQSGDVDIFKLLSAMPKEQLDTLTKEMSKGFESMPESMITQSSVSYVRSEYEKIGIDTEKTQNNYILFTGAKMLGIAMISMVATITVGFLAARVAASVGRNLRSGVFRKVMSFSNTEMNEFSTASLITRSTNDIQQIQMLMVMLLRIVFYAPIMAIGGVIKVLNTNTSMAWIIAVAVVAILSLIVVLFSVVMPKFKLVQKLVDKLNLVSREIITGIPVIRAFSTEKHEEERFDKANKNLTKTNLFVNRVMTCMMPAMMLIMNLITVLIVWRGAYSVDSGAMQVGDMMAFIQYTMQIIMSFLMISMVSIMLPRASVSATRIDEVLVSDISIKDPEKSEAQEFKEDKKGLVEFKNVSFMYPDAEEPILTNISFTAKPGETTAFIGSTGSGKSTLINLIPRFFDVTEGEILLGGVNIKKCFST
ncbi:putative ABC transporter ATP-binding protein [Clostridioides difficile]|nr:putative ABC transporter ATP-binding protein [Clostridioides difficile]